MSGPSRQMPHDKKTQFIFPIFPFFAESPLFRGAVSGLVDSSSLLELLVRSHKFTGQVMCRSFSSRRERSTSHPSWREEAIVENWVTAPTALLRGASLPASINSSQNVATDINNRHDNVAKKRARITFVRYRIVLYLLPNIPTKRTDVLFHSLSRGRAVEFCIPLPYSEICC
jgi:hypothetical protein